MKRVVNGSETSSGGVDSCSGSPHPEKATRDNIVSSDISDFFMTRGLRFFWLVLIL